MKPKNVMLLGFVNKAVDYLGKHMDEEPDTRLTELNNIDLDSLKDELNDNIGASLGTMESTMSTLLHAGNEAFDKFIGDSLGVKETISDQFNKMFDVDLEKDKKDNQKELAKLLSFYNLDNEYEKNIEQDEELLTTIRNNVTSDDTNGIVSAENENVDNGEIDTIFTEIVANEGNKQVQAETNKIYEEVSVKDDAKDSVGIIENPGIDTNYVTSNKNELEDIETQNYVSSLIDDLREQLVEEEENIKQQIDRNKEVYDRIASIYPYLTEGFIRSVYELKTNLATEYPFDRKIILLHRVRFKDVDNLRKFVEIGLNHGYTINADEEKMIVDIFKEFVNGDGKILTNIYEIANQGYLLEGVYEGYNVIVEED